MIAKTISHYKIFEKLGEGGMGVVYRAEDTKLDRNVALKFLPAHLTLDSESRERFEREAKAAAALNHPNIVTIYEIAEHENQTFIAMEYVDGQSLREKMAGKPMPVDDVIDIATQICEGLDKAHKAGIVHRDIKPENILIDSDGRVKILDFGLAKLKGASKLTKEASTVGTVFYMSPEQIKGDEVDNRSDIWSVGVVLYEMLIGQQPFKGDYEQSVMYSILNSQPMSIANARSDIPSHFVQIVDDALEKEPNKRWSSITELLKRLKKPVVESSKTQEKKSIVVLPFDDMSPDKDNEYFSDGLTEEIITDLSRIHKLRVISRNSAMMLKDSRKSTKEIGHEFNVQFILEGSVRKAGNNLRITAQLIDARTDTHLWAEKYAGILDDVFDIQEKVSRSIVDTLRIQLEPDEKSEIAKKSIDNVQAYDCYLRALRESYLFTHEGFERALKFLKMAIDIMGENALLYATTGLVYVQYYNSGLSANEETLQKAEKLADKVRALSPDSFEYHHLMGLISRHRGQALNAIKYLKKAYERNSNDSDTLMWLGVLLSVYAGKIDEAEPFVKKVIEIDPLTGVNYFCPSLFFMVQGKLEQSISYMKKWLQMDPQNRWAKFLVSRILSWDEQFDEAFQLIDQIVEEDPTDIVASVGLFTKYALQGKRDKALNALTEEARQFQWLDPEGPWFISGYLSLINEKEPALEWFEHALEMGWINYPLFSKIDPFLENIRGEERFKKLMDIVKHKWENFEV